MAFFIGIILYNFIIGNNFSFFEADKITYTYHIVDFSVGLCSKLLPGAIFNFLFKEVLPWHVTLVETVLLFIVFAAVSYFIAELICSQTDAEIRKAMVIFSLFMVTGPATFSIFVQELGMLDVYWIYFSLLFFLFISKKYLYFLIPVVYVLSVAIHFSSVISYILLFSIIILYRISKEKNGRLLLIIVLLASVISAAVLMIIFIKNETGNLKYSLDEFYEYLDSRYKMDGNTYYLYYEGSFYRVPYISSYPFENMADDVILHTGGSVPDILVNIINAFWQKIHILYYGYKGFPTLTAHLLHSVILTAPLMAFFMKFWIHKIREERKNNKLAAFSYFLMLVQFPITAVTGCLCSPDIIRFIAHAFIIQFAFILYVIFTEKEKATKWISDYILKFDKKILLMYLGVYAITLFPVYD